jgi:hypothetical protein
VITHVVVFRWKPEMPPEQMGAIVAELHTLPAIIPSIRDYRCGPDEGVVAGNFDFAVVATFDDLEAWRAYDTDAEHQRIRTEMIVPWVADRASVQLRS